MSKHQFQFFEDLSLNLNNPTLQSVIYFLFYILEEEVFN